MSTPQNNRQEKLAGLKEEVWRAACLLHRDWQRLETCLQSSSLLEKAVFSANHLLLLWGQVSGESGTEKDLPPWSISHKH